MKLNARLFEIWYIEFESLLLQSSKVILLHIWLEILYSSFTYNVSVSKFTTLVFLLH